MDAIELAAITGGYECREIFKAHGGTWNANAKEWTVTRAELAKIDAEIEELRGATGKAKRAIVASWDCASVRFYTAAPTPAPADPRMDGLRRFADQVRRTGLTHGRDADVAECVKLGLLTAGDAMNSDD